VGNRVHFSRILSVARRKRAQRAWAVLWGVCLYAFAPSGFAAETPAVQVFQTLQQNLTADKKRGDWAGFLRDARLLQAFLNASPTSSLEVARALLELHRPREALMEVRHFVAMGQTNGILDSPLFQPLRMDIDLQLRENQVPWVRARPSRRISDAGLLPEDIDYDQRSKRFFLTSILEHSIVALDAAGNQQTFVTAPDHWPIVALKVDEARRRLWATEVAEQGFTAVAAADWGRSVLLEYQLDDGTLIARHEGPARGNLGDMVLADNGDPVVSDGTGGGIYRLQRGELQRIDHGEFISPQTVAICRGHRQTFVPDYVRGIAEFDLESGAVRWLSSKDRFALDGIDGLYCHGNALIAIQNGASPQRVVAFALDRSRREIRAETVIERATNTLGDPTHGVFVGDSFFYIANSGWGALDEHGVQAAMPAATPVMKPALIMKVDQQAEHSIAPLVK
jgi:sugar lactone lactonase YvrE